MTGCGRNKSAKTHQGLNIVTSFYPMYVATINIAGDIDGVTVSNMAKPQTGCLHDYQLSTEDMKLLERADILVVNGGGMEAFIDKIVQQEPQLGVIDASEGITMIQDDEGDNPHVWVSVTNAIKQAENIMLQLSERDPAHRESYEANGRAYIAKLEALRADMHAKIDPLVGSDIITFHEAFPYFAQEFGLNIVEVIEREPGSEPAPKELESTIDIVHSSGVRALFTEPQYSAGAASTIAAATGAQIYTLDPVVTGEANEDAKNAYIEVMKKNADTLVKALVKKIK